MNIYSVIKNDCPIEALVWRYPEEDFNDNTQLIVAESEEAVFVKDGIAIEVFEGGKYTLTSSNFPFLSKIRNMLSKGVSPYNCKVYFVTKTHKLQTKWGTPNPVQVVDPVHDVAFGVRSRGAYALQVDNAKQFLTKLVGQNVQLYTEDDFNAQFRSAFLQHITDVIPQVIEESAAEVLKVVRRKTELADVLKHQLEGYLKDYGVRMVDFFIEDISIPPDDPGFQTLQKRRADVASDMHEAGKMDVMGRKWAVLQSRDILSEVASNPGAGGVAAAGAGMGMGFAAGNAFGNMAGEMFAGFNQEVSQPVQEDRPISRFTQKSADPQVSCPRCGASNPATSKFCNECGAKVAVEQVRCPECATPNTEGAKFCNECGHRF